METVSQALVKGSCPFANPPHGPKHLIFVDVGDGHVEDDFVCEDDFEGRNACPGFVPRDASPGEGAKEKCHVFL